MHGKLGTFSSEILFSEIIYDALSSSHMPTYAELR